MTDLPTNMTAIGIKQARRPRGAGAASSARCPSPARAKSWSRSRPPASTVRTCMQRKGLYPPPPGAPDIPGLEIAGEVVALGHGVDALEDRRPRHGAGDRRRLRANTASRTRATRCRSGPARWSKPPRCRRPSSPSGTTCSSAAACKAGETLLVHGGSSGIGTTAIQLAKQFGARVIVTAGSDEKCEACRKLGADVAINYKTEDFVAATKAATDGKGADVILDMVGGDYIAPQLRSRRRRRPHRADRIPGLAESDRRFPPHHAQAAAPHRLDLALALGRRQRRDRATPSSRRCCR